MRRFAFVLGCLLSFAAPAQALDLRVTFDGTGLIDGQFVREGQQGPIRFSNPNVGLYTCCGAEVAVGDDGFGSAADVRADAGTRFNLVGFDITTAFHNIFSVPLDAIADRSIIGPLFSLSLYNAIGVPDDPTLNYDPVISTVDTSDFLKVEGFRDGARIATDTLDPEQAGGRYTAPSDFADLDQVVISTTLQGHIPRIIGDTVFFCHTACGDVFYDNMDLRLRDVQVTAPVPLPAPALLLLGALAAAAGLRRRP